MALDLTKINAGIAGVGSIVQQGVGIFDSIAQRVTGTPTPQNTTTPATPAVTTPAPAPTAGVLAGIPAWALAGGAVGLILLLRRRGR